MNQLTHFHDTCYGSYVTRNHQYKTLCCSLNYTLVGQHTPREQGVTFVNIRYCFFFNPLSFRWQQLTDQSNFARIQVAIS